MKKDKVKKGEVGYKDILCVVLLLLGVVLGSALQDTLSSPVITEQRVTIVEQQLIIHKMQEALLITTNDLSLFQEKVERLREAQEGKDNLLMKVEDFYKIDLQEARKGGAGELDRLVAKHIQKFNGMGGAE